MKSVIIKSIASLLLMLSATLVTAEDLLIARSTLSFPEAMLKLQQTLKANGHVVSRVQRVDIGLTSKGYQTDKYRVVFFGRAEEIRSIADRYPDLIPYLPHKIAIFSEESETLLVASNPESLFPTNDPELSAIINQWHQDLIQVFDEMR